MWTTNCQTAFDTLKHYLSAPPILGHSDITLPFILYTDASDVGLLTQQTGLGRKHGIAFAS